MNQLLTFWKLWVLMDFATFNIRRWIRKFLNILSDLQEKNSILNRISNPDLQISKLRYLGSIACADLNVPLEKPFSKALDIVIFKRHKL